MSAVLRALELACRRGRPHSRRPGRGGLRRPRALPIGSSAARPGIELVAVANRTISEAERAYRDGGVDSPVHAGSVAELDVAIRSIVRSSPTTRPS